MVGADGLTSYREYCVLCSVEGFPIMNKLEEFLLVIVRKQRVCILEAEEERLAVFVVRVAGCVEPGVSAYPD